MASVTLASSSLGVDPAAARQCNDRVLGGVTALGGTVSVMAEGISGPASSVRVFVHVQFRPRQPEEFQRSRIKVPAQQLVLPRELLPALDGARQVFLLTLRVFEYADDLQHTAATRPFLDAVKLDGKFADALRVVEQSVHNLRDLVVHRQARLAADNPPPVPGGPYRDGLTAATNNHLVGLNTEPSGDLGCCYPSRGQGEVRVLVDEHVRTISTEFVLAMLADEWSTRHKAGAAG